MQLGKKERRVVFLRFFVLRIIRYRVNTQDDPRRFRTSVFSVVDKPSMIEHILWDSNTTQSMFCQANGEWRRCAEKHRRPRYQRWPRLRSRVRACTCARAYVKVYVYARARACVCYYCTCVRLPYIYICYNHSKATSRYHRHHNHHRRRHSVDDIVARLWHGPFVMSYDNSNSSSRCCIVLRYRCWRARAVTTENTRCPVPSSLAPQSPPQYRSRRRRRRSSSPSDDSLSLPLPVRAGRRRRRHLSAGSIARLSADRAFGVPYFDDTAVSSPGATTEVPTTKPHKDDAAQQTPSGTPQIADVGGGGGGGPVRSDTAEKPSRHPLTAVCDFVLRPAHAVFAGSCFTRTRIFSIYTDKPNFFPLCFEHDRPFQTPIYGRAYTRQ